jgi:hypothetical protein
MWRMLGIALGIAGASGAARAEPAIPPPLAAATTLYLVTITDGAARCERWTTAPDPAQPGHGVVATTWRAGGRPRGLAFEYAVANGRLRLVSYRYDEGPDSDVGQLQPRG